jgi:hypothetical protein
MPYQENIELQIGLLERALAPWREVIGDQYLGYRNHVYRMAHFSFALLGEPTGEERRKVLVAGAFHDIGIWTADTVDYIDPSVPPALDYLDQNGLAAWSDEVETMIREHHKVRSYRGPYPLVEVFRRGDLADFSLGVVRSGIPKRYVGAVQSAFPNAGFHAFLVRRLAGWVARHPLNPLPMMKW